jgi:hypothetical protein
MSARDAMPRRAVLPSPAQSSANAWAAFAPPPRAPLRDTTVAEHAALQRPTAPSTVVQVTIDRIDVRAMAELPTQRPSARPRATPSVSLSDYLHQRVPGGRG